MVRIISLFTIPLVIILSMFAFCFPLLIHSCGQYGSGCHFPIHGSFQFLYSVSLLFHGKSLNQGSLCLHWNGLYLLTHPFSLVQGNAVRWIVWIGGSTSCQCRWAGIFSLCLTHLQELNEALYRPLWWEGMEASGPSALVSNTTTLLLSLLHSHLLGEMLLCMAYLKNHRVEKHRKIHSSGSYYSF